jgi:hypothetical protein
MRKAKILKYIERTSPTVAFNDNYDTGRQTIRNELKEEIASMMSDKKTLEELKDYCTKTENSYYAKETSRIINDLQEASLFAMKWLLEFEKENEHEKQV